MNPKFVSSTATKYLFCFFALISVVRNHESTVTDTSEEEFVKIHSEKKVSVVFFYAPWCGHCKNFMPEFDKFYTRAATEIPHVFVAKVDATKSTKLSQQYQIQGYPTLLLLKDTKICKFGAERTEQKLMEWTKGILSPSLVETSEQVDSILANPLHSIVVFFEGESNQVEQVIVDSLCEGSISSQGGIHFVKSKQLAEKMKFPAGINLAIFKSGVEPRFYDGPVTKNDISVFIAFGSNPLVVEYSSANNNILFHSAIHNYLFVHIKKDETDIQTLIPTLETLATEFFGTVRICWVDVESSDGKSAMEFFGIRHTPSLVIYNISSSKVYADISAGVIEIDKTRKFINDYVNMLLKPHRKEQPVPEDWNKGPVYQLVAGNFDEVLKWGKPTLVKFYAPWCGHCQALIPVWDKLGTEYNLPDNNGDVVIAKCDSTQNEIEGVTVQHFPTLIAFLPDGSKVPYEGERTYEAIKSFIEGGFKVAPKSDKKDAKQKPAEDSEHDEL